MTPVHLSGAYLDRSAHTVGIVRDRGEGQVWRWVTTRGYYVRTDGRASLSGPVRQDLVRECLPTPQRDTSDTGCPGPQPSPTARPSTNR